MCLKGSKGIKYTSSRGSSRLLKEDLAQLEGEKVEVNTEKKKRVAANKIAMDAIRDCAKF